MVFIILSYLLLFPSDVKIQVLTSTDTMTIGEMLVYTIQYSYPENVKLIGEPATDFNDFEITRIQEYEPVKQNNIVTRKTEYVLTTFNIDTFLIRGPRITYLNKGDTQTVQADSKLIIVKSVLDTNAADIRPEKPIIEGDINWTAVILLGVAGLILLGVIVYVLIRMYNRYQRNKLLRVLQKPVIVRTPEELALEELARLQEKRYIDQGEYKKFHIEVSNVIRTYLENGWRITALEMPTSDLIYSLKKQPVFSEAYILLLRRFLEVCDLVKFAKYPASSEECKEIMDQAYDLVKTAGHHEYKTTNRTNVPEQV
jgi:hypothetical protein